MSKITLDDLVLWWYAEEKRSKTWRGFVWLMLPCFLIMTLALLAYLLKPPDLPVVIAVLVCVLWVGWNLTRLMLVDRHDTRFGRELSHRADRVPLSKLCLALKLYDRKWQIAAVECEEAHLPGDCPLCGAT